MTLLQEIQIISSHMQFFHLFGSLSGSIPVGIARQSSQTASNTLDLLFCQFLKGIFSRRKHLPCLT